MTGRGSVSDAFQTESPAEAARLFKHATAALVVSALAWVVGAAAVPGVVGAGAWVGPVVVVGLAAEGIVVAAFLRSAVEYAVWVRQSIDLFD